MGQKSKLADGKVCNLNAFLLSRSIFKIYYITDQLLKYIFLNNKYTIRANIVYVKPKALLHTLDTFYRLELYENSKGP